MSVVIDKINYYYSYEKNNQDYTVIFNLLFSSLNLDRRVTSVIPTVSAICC